MITNNEIEARVAKAQELFKQGFNCSQSVFAACADLYGITDLNLALRLGASFGGGIGRMRLTCGAACGMFLLAGLENGSSAPGDAEGKKHNYELVQRLAADFKSEYGSITCADLLGLNNNPQSTIALRAHNPQISATPSTRTEEYYRKRPCVEMVGNAVRIYLTAVGGLTVKRSNS